MADRPTINDVAREAGVSKASVSAVLNGKADLAFHGFGPSLLDKAVRG